MRGLPFMLGAAMLLVACAVPDRPADLGARLAAANLLAGSLAAGLDQVLDPALGEPAILPGSGTAIALLVTLDAVELALDGAGNAFRAHLPQLAEANLAAAERQMAGLQLAGLRPLPPSVVVGGQ